MSGSTSQPFDIADATDRFDAEWHGGRSPRIADFLRDVADPEERLRLLFELIPVDLEYRWKGEAAGQGGAGQGGAENTPNQATITCSFLVLEDYRRSFPELAALPRLPDELIAEEYRVRHRWGDRPSHAIYGNRFRESWPALENILFAIDEELARDATTPPLPPRRAGTVAAGTLLPSVAGAACRVEAEVGRGGMGIVIRGHDPDFDRSLAIKLLRPEYRGDADMERRFLDETRIMGRLQHPGIAPVHGLGRLDDGRPFFTMKLIEGQSLAALLDSRPAPSAELQRFAGIFDQICQTMAYAHSQGIVHRDLKPQNILVGAFGEVQVMDWGLAKHRRQATQDEETDAADGGSQGKVDVDAERTRAGSVLGTPAFMAPEQARGDVGRIDERCDVFGLGAILCVILTGKPPYTSGNPVAQARDGDLADAMARLDGSGADSELTHLAKRCLALNPQERPPDAGAVAEGMSAYRTAVAERLRQAEVERAQAELKVEEERKRRRLEEARADEEQKRRQAEQAEMQAERRRRRTQLVLAAILVIGLTGGTAGALWGLFQVDEARRAAVAAQIAEASRAEGERLAKLKAEAAVKAERIANDQARKRLKQIEKGNEILSSVFADLDQRKIDGQGKLLKQVLGERLKLAAMQLQGEAVGDPLVVARLQNRLATSIRNLGYYADAIPLLQASFETRETFLGPDAQETLESLNDLALAYKNRGLPEKALPLSLKAFERSRANLGPDHPGTLDSLNNLAGVYQDLGQPKKALPLFKEAFERRRASLPPEHPATLVSLSNLAFAYGNTGRPDLALPLHEKALRMRRAKLGPDHFDTLSSMNNLAAAYREIGQPEKALPLLQETVERSTNSLGPDHPETLDYTHNLAGVYWTMTRLDQALAMFEQTLKGRQARLGSKHPDTLWTMAFLGIAYKDAGRFADAVTTLQTPYAHGRGQARLAWVGSALVEAYLMAGHKAEKTSLEGGLSKTQPESIHDVKWVGGTLYCIDMRSTDFDSYLKLVDDKGTLVAENDDIPPFKRKSLDSRIVFTPPADGAYRIVATSFGGRGVGDYSLTIRAFAAKK